MFASSSTFDFVHSSCVCSRLLLVDIETLGSIVVVVLAKTELTMASSSLGCERHPRGGGLLGARFVARLFARFRRVFARFVRTFPPP